METRKTRIMKTKFKKIGIGYKYFNKKNIMCIQLHLNPFLTKSLSKESFNRIYVTPVNPKFNNKKFDYVVLTIKEANE